MQDEGYERATRDFVMRFVAHAELPDLLGEIEAFVQSIAAAGVVNSLAQLLLKLTVPGVPDFYQGTEYWDLSLVDPDNRRPVEFDRRRNSLHRSDPVSALAHWRDGEVKQALAVRVLALRRSMPALFSECTYERLAMGSDQVLGFLRRHGENAILVVVPTRPTQLMRERDAPRLDPVRLRALPFAVPGATAWHDVLRGLPCPEPALPGLLRDLPVALLSTRSA